MEIGDLTQKLAEVRKKIVALVEKINMAADKEPFYARFTLEDYQHLTGLIENLKVNGYKLLFDFTNEELVDGQIVRKKIPKKIKFEELRRVDVFETKSGRKLFIK